LLFALYRRKPPVGKRQPAVQTRSIVRFIAVSFA
jgi:hypothetical protein